MDKRLDRITDERLRDIPCDPEGLKQYIGELTESLKSATEPKSQVKLLGEIGVHLRSLEKLEEAGFKLQEALKIIEKNQLGIKLEMQQKIRWAHVLQWQGLFEDSNQLFHDIISVCRNDSEARIYLDFALQHSGKNLFEQKKYAEALAQFEEALKLRKDRSAPSDQIESTRFAIEITQKAMAKVPR